MIIKAPFNFVPYSENVYFPDWADQVSQDVPFSDGKSGIIYVNIIAKTDIFVRNGHTADTEENEFSYYVDNNGNKQYFIPGSSLKGMIRSVFEANSFCKLTQLNDSKFPYRDVSDDEYRDKLKHVHCGYLRKISSNEYVLSDHGTPGRIAIKDLSMDLYNHFCANNLPTKESVASAKYDFVQKKHISLPTLFVEDKERNTNKPQGVDNREFFMKANSGQESTLQGEIVFTGQNSRRVDRTQTEIELEYEKDTYKIKGQTGVLSVEFDKKIKNVIDDFIEGKEVDLTNVEKRIKNIKYKYENRSEQREWRFIEKDGKTKLFEIKAASGKAYEFVFFEKHTDYNLLSSDQCMADFFSMYKYSPDFKGYFSEKSNKKERVPVFFTVDSDNVNQETIRKASIGLSYLFKYPYNNSVLSAVGANHKDDRPDLAEIVFGSTNFKGRVRFTHAQLVNQGKPKSIVTTILASPRASYAPIYLQNGTWKNPSVIKGRKRYLIYEQANAAGRNNNAEVETAFIPLPSGSRFTAKVFFHNLKEIELGALLSALTFHGNEQLFHSVGTAKPYGYGKVNLTVEKIELSDNGDKNEILKSDWLKYLSKFEDDISKNIEPEWKKTSQIINLHAIAKGIPANKVFEFRYMRMNIDNPNENEFAAAKKASEALQYYDRIIGEANTFQSQDVNKLIQTAIDAETERQRKKEEERQKEDQANTKRNNALIWGAKYGLGDSIKIEVVSGKKGMIIGSDVEIQIVTKLPLSNGQRFTGKVKQKAKDGRIIQVGYDN